MLSVFSFTECNFLQRDTSHAFLISYLVLKHTAGAHSRTSVSDCWSAKDFSSRLLISMTWNLLQSIRKNKCHLTNSILKSGSQLDFFLFDYHTHNHQLLECNYFYYPTSEKKTKQNTAMTVNNNVVLKHFQLSSIILWKYWKTGLSFSFKKLINSFK